MSSGYASFFGLGLPLSASSKSRHSGDSIIDPNTTTAGDGSKNISSLVAMEPRPRAQADVIIDNSVKG